jgi:hypothetical protein
MSHIGEITQGIILGPAELCAEFEEPGLAVGAKANLDVFLKWNFSAPTADGRAAPAVALIVNQIGIDPYEDRVRRSDFSEEPASRIEGNLVVLPAPKSRHGRSVLRKVLLNSKPRRIFDRPKKGTHPRVRVLVAAAVALALLGGGAAAFLAFTGRL